MTPRQRMLGVLVVVVAALLRFDRIWHWSLDGDEYYAWRDVTWLLEEGRVAESLRSHPLGYLGMAAVVEFAGATEWALRLFSTTLGTLAVAALTFMRRDALPARVGLLAGGWVALSPWLVYHAQTARVYGPLFLFATLAVLWWLPGDGRRPLAGAVALVLAAASHPSAFALLPGVLLAAVVDPATRRRALVGGGSAVALGAAVLVASDATVVQLVVEAFERRDFARYDALHYVLGLGYNSHGVLLPAAVGLVLLVLSRDRGLGWLTSAAFVGPGLLGLAALIGVSVHQRYALASVPAVFLAAAVCVDHLAARGRRRLALVLAAVPFVVPLPAVAGHLRDGNRHDWRGMAEILAERASPDDIIAADEHALLELYLGRHPGFDDEELHHEVPFDNDAKYVGFLGNRREVWVVLKASRVDGGYGDRFRRWLDEHFEEVARWGRSPLPLTRHDNTLVLYRRVERVLPGRAPGR